MPLFLLANWKWLLPSAAAAVLAILLGVARLEIAALETAAAKTALDIERQKVDAANILAAAEKHARDLVEKNALLNIQLEKDHADAAKKLDAVQRDNRALTSRIGGLLREATRRGACGADNLPASGGPAGGSPGTADGAELASAVERLIAGATELFREGDAGLDVGVICHRHAMSAAGLPLNP